MTSEWLARTQELTALSQRQLFFIGGAPRSGTTWLQQMLDTHPQVMCRGEGLFLHQLAVPLEAMLAQREKVVAGKNRALFAHTGGFPHVVQADVEHLIGTAILLAFKHYEVLDECRAIGEKTPENIFFFPRLQELFPQARFVAIARDPRDVLSSAWHYFGKPQGKSLEAFVEIALPSLQAGMKATLGFARANQQACRIVTYELLQQDPAGALAELFTFLEVRSDSNVIQAIIEATRFSAISGGREAGTVLEGSFHRRGVVGDWRDTLPDACNRAVLQALGWSFVQFGWEE